MPPSETLAGWTERDGLLAESRLSALRHGFTTRRLGNMADPESRARLRARGIPEPLTLKQVHGTAIHEAAADRAGADGDGWLVTKPGFVAAVYVADCVPLFLWSDDLSLAGVFHAGWRGTAQGMAKAAVAAFAARGVPAARLSAALGPHAGACCYRVGPELRKDFPESSFVRRGGALHLDLAAENRRQLAAAGVPAENLGAPAPCTVCGPDYFSYRRDQRGARMFAVLSLDRWPS
ncbi:MAG: polyphenol oxidase family protein [Elusimicrobia bacterium]|nr:polyphenol oxidase family protein [Elusimicrobiota bacterium]